MTPERLQDLWRAVLAVYSVPPARLGVPEMDGHWTTPYADWLDSIGLRREAHAERYRAVLEARRG